MNKIRRNTLTVRVLDNEHEDFLKHTSKKYSTTLRALIRFYNNNITPEDMKYKPEERIRRIAARTPNED